MRTPVVVRRAKLLLSSPRPFSVLPPAALPRRPKRLSTAASPDDPAPANDDKPKLRRLRPPQIKDPDPAVELPHDLDVLWSPGTVHADALPPPENFDDALNKLLITLHPQTQHRATYASPLGAPTEPTLALYSPIEGGDYIIDATVAELARRTGAEVLVLDAVQLAAGEWGQFGPAANSLSLPRNPLHFPPPRPSSSRSQPDEEEDPDAPYVPPKISLALLAPPSSMQGRTILASPPRRTAPPSKVKVFFDALVNTPSKVDSAAPAPNKPRPRLVYVRDFPTLASTSSSWYPPLLSAVRERRKGPISRPSSPVCNPMTIIFGMTPPLSPPASHNGPGNSLVSMLVSRTSSAAQLSSSPKAGKPDWGEDDAAERAREKRLRDRLKKWESGDAVLSEEFPRLSTLEEGEDETRPEVILISSLGLPGLPGSNTSNTAQNKSSFFRTSVLIPKVRSLTHERAARISRRREINELTMRMGIGAAGGVLERESAAPPQAATPDSEPSSQTPAAHEQMWEDWGNRIEVWQDVRRIADRALGNTLAAAASGAAEPTLESTTVPWSAVHTAWAAHRSAKDLRSSWLKEAFSVHKVAWEQEKPDESLQEDTQEHFDEVVERVKSDAELERHEERLLGCIVDSGTLFIMTMMQFLTTSTASMPTSFDQVHLPAHTIDSVRTIVSLPLLHPKAFQQGILKQHGMTGCLLFGPPGTGKTLVVRALAKEAGCRMLMVSPSDVMDMYVGEGEKLVKALFSLARRLSPCVVFLDEIDALFGARMSARESGGAFAHRGVITEFMQEMDGLKSSKEDNVIVIGATNRPFDLDDAVLRRLPRRLLVDLPGEKEREEILKILLRDEVLAPDLDISALAKKTESFSGSDLKHLCVSAALDAVKENVKLPWATTSSVAAPSTQLSEGTMSTDASSAPSNAVDSPSASSGAEALPVVVESFPTEQPTRILHLHNFAKALKEITPSSSESLGSLAELRKWNEEFGEGNSNKKRQSFWGKGRFGFTDKAGKGEENGRIARPTSRSSADDLQ
ncbi:hypothetical protein C0993_011523 [Termitomyces sp. T159_Od127]|nr:hypothetical protein C0993_011523 [Termitomyces sp. T159_Od127]